MRELMVGAMVMVRRDDGRVRAREHRKSSWWRRTSLYRLGSRRAEPPAARPAALEVHPFTSM